MSDRGQRIKLRFLIVRLCAAITLFSSVIAGASAFTIPASESSNTKVKPPRNCDSAPSVPQIVPDPRGADWGHTIMVDTALGPSPPAAFSSCSEVKAVACQEVHPDVMDDFPRAMDALPDSGGIVIVLSGVHVVTREYKHRRPFRVLHVQGVPDACGRRPIVRSTLTRATKNHKGRWQRPKVKPKGFISFAAASKNLILENIEVQNFSSSCVSIGNSERPDSESQTVLVKNSFIHHCYSQAIAMSKGPLRDRKGRLYVIDSELGYVWSGNHLLYMSGGESFFTRNSFYHSPGWHALKVVAHNVAVLDSVLSQVGLAGSPMPQVGAVYEGERIGQGSAGSFVACQRGVFQRNTIMAVTPTAGVTRQPRKAIDGCDFEVSYYPLLSGEWPNSRKPGFYPSAPTRFWSPAFWEEVADAGLSFPQASHNPHLLPIYWWENRFVYVGDEHERQAVTNSSTYPIRSGAGEPHDLVPDDWLERSRDVFLNNTLVNYKYPKGLHRCGSRAKQIKKQCRDIVLVDAGGNNGKPIAVPDWFVTEPREIHPSLSEPTIKDLYEYGAKR